MLDTPFARIELLPPGSQVRTLLPPFASLPSFGRDGSEAGESWDLLWSRIVEWSVKEYEGWKDRREEEQQRADLEELSGQLRALDSRDTRTRATYDDLPAVDVANETLAAEEGTDRFPLFFASTLSSLLALLQLIPPAPSSISNSP
ncbi:hypothetical protein JCM10296v2_005685, partial [Rhodotorula toruloides]